MGDQRTDRAGRVAVGFVFGTLAALAIYGLPLAQQTVPISGNHLNNVASTAELPDSQPLQADVIMALDNRDQLVQLEADLQNRDSPRYHQWLTPDQFAERFGPTPQQMQAVVNWLGGRGLLVTGIDQIARTVRFSGSYAEVKAALQVKIVTDGDKYANVTDPQVPVELASTIVSIEGLTRHDGVKASTTSDSIVTSCTHASGRLPCNSNPYFGPADLYTYYDETPVLKSGNLGTGSPGSSTANDCIAMPETSSIKTAALDLFVRQFAKALPSPAAMPTIAYSAVSPPVGGATPAATPGLPSDNEPYLDAE